jgi:hypothetical protein
MAFHLSKAHPCGDVHRLHFRKRLWDPSASKSPRCSVLQPPHYSFTSGGFYKFSFTVRKISKQLLLNLGLNYNWTRYIFFSMRGTFLNCPSGDLSYQVTLHTANVRHGMSYQSCLVHERGAGPAPPIPIKEIIIFAAITYEVASQHKIMGAE